MTTTITEAQYNAHEAHQERMRQREAYAGLLSLAEAAAITGMHRNSIKKAALAGRLRWRKERGKTGGYWVHPVDLRELYPWARPTLRD